MSSPDNGLPSIGDQKQIIAANLNATVITTFLTGTYIAIHTCTMYIYWKSGDHATVSRRIVTFTLTSLFGVIVVLTILNWFYSSMVLCREGDSRLTIFVATATNGSLPMAAAISMNLLQNISLLLADGLMVWRSFNVCGRSIVGFALPMGFFFSEITLVIVSLVYRILYTLEPSFKTIQRARQGNYIVGALFCATAATSLMATSAICYKIYSSTAWNRQSRRRYKHVVDTLIQSSTMYTLIVLIATVAGFLDTGKVKNSVKIIVLNNYFESLMIMASGIFPTLMVGRLAVKSLSETSTFEDAGSSVDLPSNLRVEPGEEILIN